jgi:hypothetical protein
VVSPKETTIIKSPATALVFQPCAWRFAFAEDLIEALSEEVLRKPTGQNFS